MLNLTIYLRERFLAAHGQNRMSEAHEQNDPGEMTEPGPVQPSHGFLGNCYNPGMKRIGRQLDRPLQHCECAPQDEHDYHDAGDDHDLECLAARFVEAPDV